MVLEVIRQSESCNGLHPWYCDVHEQWFSCTDICPGCSIRVYPNTKGNIMSDELNHITKLHAELASLHAFHQTVKQAVTEHDSKVREVNRTLSDRLAQAHADVSHAVNVALDDLNEQLTRLNPDDYTDEDES